MRFFREKGVFAGKLLISYVLMLVIPIAVIGFIYVRTVEMVERDLMDSNLSMLEQSRDILDKHLQEVESLVTGIALDPHVISLTTMETLQEGSRDVETLIGAVEDLSNFRMTNGFIREWYLYFNRSDILLTSASASTRMRLLYGKYFHYGDLSYTQWREEVAMRPYSGRCLPATKVALNGRETLVIPYLQTIPLEYPKANRGCAMVFIDEAAVGKLLSKVNIGADGYVCVLGPDDELITSVHAAGKSVVPPAGLPLKGSGVMKAHVAGEEMVISCTTSEDAGWKYVSVVPARYALTKVRAIRNIIGCAALGMLLLGMLLSLYWSDRNAKPIRDLVERLRNSPGVPEGGRNEVECLMGGINGLIDRNQDLGKTLEAQRPIVTSDFLKRLLGGQLTDAEQIADNLAHLGIPLSGSGFVVLIVELLGYRDLINPGILSELELARLVIRQEAVSGTAGRSVACDLDETGVAVILGLPATDAGTVRQEVTALAERLFAACGRQNGMYAAIAVGSTCDGLELLGESHADARFALDHSAAEPWALVWCDAVAEQTEHYRYGLSTEKRLVDLVAAGESEALERLLDLLFAENFQTHRQPECAQRLFVRQLSGTLARAAEQADARLPACVYDWTEPRPEEGFHIAAEALRALCADVQARKGSRDSALERQILEYVRQQCGHEDLTLHQVAAQFHLSETYAYHFFRAKIGTTFASYLEDLRMDRAYHLLIETDLTISDIAGQVGYGSVHSFRRAFKRCRGMIPSELRNASAPEGEEPLTHTGPNA